jgi:hypothetical protein
MVKFTFAEALGEQAPPPQFPTLEVIYEKKHGYKCNHNVCIAEKKEKPNITKEGWTSASVC